MCWKRIGCVAFVLSLASGVYADPLTMESAPVYPTVIQGFEDPIHSYIYNTAPTGSAAVNYTVFDTLPYGNSDAYNGTKAADGGTGYDTSTGYFNTSLVNGGTYTVSTTVTNTGTDFTLTQSSSVLVLAHAVPAFNIGGTIYQLPDRPPEPAAQAPSVDQLASGATDSGESFAASAPNVIGDPVVPTAGLDLDSIAESGSPEITLSLSPFTNLAADDDPAHGVPFQILVPKGTAPGHYFTVFELDYSDQQDLPGADAPGSKHAYFGVSLDVTATGFTGAIVIPEPETFGLVAIGLASLLPLLRRVRRAARS